MNILSINAGSSSLKYAIHAIQSQNNVSRIYKGSVSGLGTPEASLSNSNCEGQTSTRSVPGIDLRQAFTRAISPLTSGVKVDAVGCRVVHGGAAFYDPVPVNESVLEQLRALAPLAPLHNARDVETIESARLAVVGVPVYAVFDTAFHRSLPPVAFTYAIPAGLSKDHEIRRYGFHGISYQYAAKQMLGELGEKAQKMVVCHLGNGASVCALLDGVSIDTSMGLTPLEGLVMGTRCGDIDPGLVLFLERELGMSVADADSLLNHKSGLLGLSGLTADVKELEASDAPAAKLALDVFAYRLAKYIGSYAVALGGLDALVFTGGIGENSADMRARVCGRLDFLGAGLDSDANAGESTGRPRQIGFGEASVWIVNADEERQIALEVYRVRSNTT